MHLGVIPAIALLGSDAIPRWKPSVSNPLNSMKVLYSNVMSSIDMRNADTIEENLYPIDNLFR